MCRSWGRAVIIIRPISHSSRVDRMMMFMFCLPIVYFFIPDCTVWGCQYTSGLCTATCKYSVHI